MLFIIEWRTNSMCIGHVEEGAKMGNYIFYCCVDVIIYPCPKLFVGLDIEDGTVNKLNDTTNNVNAIIYCHSFIKRILKGMFSSWVSAAFRLTARYLCFTSVWFWLIASTSMWLPNEMGYSRVSCLQLGWCLYWQRTCFIFMPTAINLNKNLEAQNYLF